MTGFVCVLEGGPLDGETWPLDTDPPPAVIYAFVCQHNTDGPCDLQTAARDRSGHSLRPDDLRCHEEHGSHWFWNPIFPGGDPRQHAYDFHDFAPDGAAVYRNRTKTREGHHA